MSKARPQPTPQYSHKSSKDFDTYAYKPQSSAPVKESAYNEKLGKNEVQELKKKVQEINYMMNKRKRSAIKIQKVWRGFLSRRRLARIKPKLVQQKIERVKKQRKKDYIRKNAKKIICEAIYNYVLKKRNQEKELLKRYVNHCATMIQKTFRGAITRMRCQQMRRRMRRFRFLLTAFALGWKTRKILKDQTLMSMFQDIQEIEELARDIADNDDFEAVSTKEEIPWRLSRLKRQYLDRFYELYYTGSWVYREDPRHRKQSSRRAHNDENDEPEYYQYKRRGGQNRQEPEDDQYYNENQNQQRRRGNNRKPSYGDGEDYNDPYRHSNGEREANAWEAREEIPIGGKGKYVLPDEMEEPDVGQERSGKKNRNATGWDERDEIPITGKGTYDIPDDGEAPPVTQNKRRGGAKRRDNNAFDAKEDQPVGGKGEYVIPDDMAGEAFKEADGGEAKARPRREIAKKKKYDPRKALEEAKKKEEEGGESATKNKKSEAFRDMIRNVRKAVADEKDDTSTEKGQEDKSAKKPVARRGRTEKRPQVGEDSAKNEEEEKENIQQAEEEEGGEKKFKFLKRKTKAVINQKVDWNKVGSRIDCWVDKTKEAPKSPEREKITITTSTSTSRPKTAHANQENMRSTMNQDRGGPGRSELPAKSPMRQRGGKNEKPEEIVQTVKEVRPAEIKNEPKKKKAVANNKARTAQQHRIKIEELEKAYNTNFLNKLNHITQKFYSESGARDPEEHYTSTVPILRLNSAFFFRDDMEQYHEILAQLNEEYQSLQIVN